MDTLRGRLLVATPAIETGPFVCTVVYLLDHDADGALGVIVNRPLPSDVDDVLPQWADHVNAPVCLFDGGPVEEDAALAVGVLAPADAVTVPPLGWRAMAGRVGLVDLDGPLPAAGQLAGLRLFAGYAGWSPGQVEAEIEEGAWLVLESRESDLMSPQPEELWHEVMRRQSGDLRYWATFPADPRHN
jgi:putative transcriptional regulator